jgi:hypothetical protein
MTYWRAGVRIAKALLVTSSALAVFLAFAWPFVVSPDASSAVYRILAIGALGVILAAITWLATCKMFAARTGR